MHQCGLQPYIFSANAGLSALEKAPRIFGFGDEALLEFGSGFSGLRRGGAGALGRGSCSCVCSCEAVACPW